MKIINILKILLITTLYHPISGIAQSPDWEWLSRGGGTGTWGFPNPELDDESTGVVTDKYGNTTVCGRFFNSGSTNIDGKLVSKYGMQDGFVVQYDCSGNIRWKFTFGGSLNNIASDVTNDTLGNIYITGQISASTQITDSIYFSDTTFKFNGGQSFIAKIDTIGHVQWIKIAFSGNQLSYSRGLAIDCKLNKVNVLLWSQGPFSEYAPGDTIQHGYLIASYTLDGKLLGVFHVYEYGAKLDLRDISIDNNGHSYLAGTVNDSILIGTSNFDPGASSGEAIVLRFSNNGSFLWGTMSSPPGGAGLAHGFEIEVMPSKSNTFYLVGSAYRKSKFGALSLLNANSMTGYIVKYENSIPTWIRNVENNTANNQIYNLDMDNVGNIVVSGTVLGSGTIVPDTLTSKDIQDPYIAMFDEYGNTIFAHSIPCKGDYGNKPTGIAAGFNGNVFLTGTFESRIELPNDSVFSQGGNTDFFLAKFGIEECEDTTSAPVDTNDFIGEFQLRKSMQIFPNPSSGDFLIDLGESRSGALNIFNSMGDVVYNTSIQNSQKINVSLANNIPVGIYFVQFDSDYARFSGRVVIE